MAKFPLYVTQSAKFINDGKGGTIARTSMAPTIYGVTWKIKRVVTTTTSIDGQSEFRLYKNTESDANLIDGSYSGNQDSADIEIPVGTLDNMICVWINGDLDSFATVTFTGEVDNGR